MQEVEVKLFVNPLPLDIRTSRALLFVEHTLYSLGKELTKYLVTRSELDERVGTLMKDEFIAEVVAKGRLVRREGVRGPQLINKLKELVGKLGLGKALVSINSSEVDAKILFVGASYGVKAKKGDATIQGREAIELLNRLPEATAFIYTWS